MMCFGDEASNQLLSVQWQVSRVRALDAKSSIKRQQFNKSFAKSCEHKHLCCLFRTVLFNSTELIVPLLSPSSETTQYMGECNGFLLTEIDFFLARGITHLIGEDDG